MRGWALLCSHRPRTPFRGQGPWEPWNKVAGEQDRWGSRVVGEFADAMTLVEHGSRDIHGVSVPQLEGGVWTH